MSALSGRPGTAPPAPTTEPKVDDWCRRWLGAPPAAAIFQAGNLSSIVGLRLADGREVVVKVRPAAERLTACVEVQRRLWAAGFPCPEPLAGPAALGDGVATAETLVRGGAQLTPGPDAPWRFARALAELVAQAPRVADLPTLNPPPAWLLWDGARRATWPRPASTPVDLNGPEAPGWLEALARRARRRLARCRRPPVVGHGDFESQNVRWAGQRLHVVHDWDSVVAAPEPVIAGAGAVVFPATSSTAAAADVAQTRAFLAAYEHRRGGGWSDDDREVSWAAGLWVMAYCARIELAERGGGPVLARLAGDGRQRLGLAGA